MTKRISRPDYTTLKEIIISTPDETTKALMAYIYGGCARLGEITRPDYYHSPQRIGQPSIQAQDHYVKNEAFGLRVYLKIGTSKQKSQLAERHVPLNPEKEKWLTDILAYWLVSFQDRFPNSTTQELFPFSSTWGYLLIKKNVGYNPHLLRHARATHYLLGEVTGKRMTLEEVKKIGGWKSIGVLSNVYSGVEMESVSRNI